MITMEKGFSSSTVGGPLSSNNECESWEKCW